MKFFVVKCLKRPGQSRFKRCEISYSMRTTKSNNEKFMNLLNLFDWNHLASFSSSCLSSESILCRSLELENADGLADCNFLRNVKSSSRALSEKLFSTLLISDRSSSFDMLETWLKSTNFYSPGIGNLYPIKNFLPLISKACFSRLFFMSFSNRPKYFF